MKLPSFLPGLPDELRVAAVASALANGQKMPPRMPLRLLPRSLDRRRSLRPLPPGPVRSSVCLFCSFARAPPPRTRAPKKRRAPGVRGLESVAAGATAATEARPLVDPRKVLEEALLALQKHAANHVNLSRLQLALGGLRQKPGREPIRVAILGLNSGPEASQSAREVLRLLLADPLKDAEPWETEVGAHDLAQPLIVRVGAGEQGQPGALSYRKGNWLHEVNVSSATLNGHSLELLVMETNPFTPAPKPGAIEDIEESVLVPTVDIPVSKTGRYTPLTTPVHKALVVADDIMGAASLGPLPTLESQNVISTAVNLPAYTPRDGPVLPFTLIDVDTANVGLELVRRNLGNAVEYEHLWYQSKLPTLVEWLKSDILTTPDGATKPPVRRLIASLLQNASASIRAEEARQRASARSSSPDAVLPHLQTGLEEWAERAHTELQEQLDLAFSSRRWRRLGWWKLFWRVDDVGMTLTDLLGQRFLPDAERGAIYLAGRLAEAGVALPAANAGSSPGAALPPPPSVDTDAPPPPSRPDRPAWPPSIPATRAHLQDESIPALQALAQKLVLQALSTAGLATALGALVYAGTLTTTLYEAGAVAAIGVAWGLRRMQRRWEAARASWAGDVREDGRRALRDAQGRFRAALADRGRSGPGAARPGAQDEAGLRRAKELVARAAEALERMR